ncbi:MAG: phosphonate ABC transporter substrate-binding protein [Bacteriovoracaceae bacterium]|nr:phosphonate ABC transporter substrate-binding protein [Bacteriovoracaceae bacterium]
MKLKRQKFIIIICLFLFAFCVMAKSKWPSVIKIGVIPIEGGTANVNHRFGPMAEHLERKLGIKVKLITATDYAGIITAMAHDHIDFSYLGAKTYIEAKNRAGAEIIVKEINERGFHGYRGIIITRADSGILKLENAKGKTFAFIDPNSTSGYLVPYIRFKRAHPQINPQKFFKKVMFSGSHPASILSVKNGSVDLAATNDVDLDRMALAGKVNKKEFRILWTSEIIPGGAVVGRKSLPESLKRAFGEAMIKMNASIQKHMQNSGFRWGKDEEYDVVRYLIKLKKDMGK